jgi:hypothetical protein
MASPSMSLSLEILIHSFSPRKDYISTQSNHSSYCHVILSPCHRSIGYSEECLGLHYGQLHLANLGDGDDRKVEQFLARQYYFPIWGTCWESLAGRSYSCFSATSQWLMHQGGHHFRAWKQNGTLANSGAWFIG